MTSCALPKTEPVGDDLQDLQSTALRSTDDDDDDDDDETVSINSVEKNNLCFTLPPTLGTRTSIYIKIGSL